MPPERSNLILATHVPHIELDILIRDTLDVESDGGNSGDVLVCEFKLIKDCYSSMLAKPLV